MRKLKYISGYDESDAIELDIKGSSIQTAPELFSCGYVYEKTSRAANKFSIAKKEVEIEAVFTSQSTFNHFRDVALKDIRHNTCGTLVASQTGFFMPCFVPVFDIKKRSSQSVTCSITFTFLSEVWRKKEILQHRPVITQRNSGGADLPHDMPYDLNAAQEKARIKNKDSVVCIIFYGPVVDPYIIVGGNTYKIHISLADGDRLVVDAIANPKRIYKVDANGRESDQFSKAERGAGEGSGMYIFERIKEIKGEEYQNITFPQGLAFDVVTFDEREYLLC